MSFNLKPLTRDSTVLKRSRSDEASNALIKSRGSLFHFSHVVECLSINNSIKNQNESSSSSDDGVSTGDIGLAVWAVTGKNKSEGGSTGEDTSERGSFFSSRTVGGLEGGSSGEDTSDSTGGVGGLAVWVVAE